MFKNISLSKLPSSASFRVFDAPVFYQKKCSKYLEGMERITYLCTRFLKIAVHYSDNKQRGG